MTESDSSTALGLFLHDVPADAATGPRRPAALLAQEEVLDRVEVVAQRQVLEDGVDAGVGGRTGRVEAHGLASHPDLPASGDSHRT